jgi:predicted metal-dependent hydrolase
MQLRLPLSGTAPSATASSATAPRGAAPSWAAPPGSRPAGDLVRDPADEWIFVRRRRARRYILRVDPDGRVRVTIPRGGSRLEADAFARRHAAWIAQQRASLVASVVDPVGREVLKRRATDELPRRLHDLAAQFGLTVTRVSIRDQRTRWGSCGRDGHICVNWRLVLMPDAVRDYVLIHELMHLRRMDHSPAFWRCVAAACPDYATARAWLRLNGPSLR